MSLEKGGRADKRGNTFENRFLASLLISLAREKIRCVKVETVGPYSDSFEYLAESINGDIDFYQCKGSNGAKNYWSLENLNKLNIFKNAKDIIDAGENNNYRFISPLPYNELDELCNRSRKCESSLELTSFSLENSKLRNNYYSLCSLLGLNAENIVDQNYLLNFLRHCYFDKTSDGDTAKRGLEDIIDLAFSGEASSTRVLLENWINDEEKYGVTITANDVRVFLQKNGVYLRSYIANDSTLETIRHLNSAYNQYNAIHSQLIHRVATDNIIAHFENDKSVIIHGRAGAGKSGCIQEFCEYLDENNILYLLINLIHFTPAGSADRFGESMGLPESPVHCISKLAAGKKCVIILDQLDALRWTSSHSCDALAVCKKMIRQVSLLNKEGENISIVFASRTFDLKNDSGLKALFEKENDLSLDFEKVNVDVLSESDVVGCIGSQYNSLPAKLKEILKVPSSLYIWTKLDSRRRLNSISTVYDLMGTWWKQICETADLLPSIGISRIISCIEKIKKFMEDERQMALPKALFTENLKEIDFFISNGLICLNESDYKISFAHQSFLDYFFCRELLEKIYLGENLNELVGNTANQTFLQRYRLQTVLLNLIEDDTELFSWQCESLMNDSSVRFYFKCAIFETIGQFEKPTKSILNFLSRYIGDVLWSELIFNVVLWGHPKYVEWYIDLPSTDKLTEKTARLLGSVVNLIPDKIITILENMPSSYPDEYKLQATSNYIKDEPEAIFEYRLRLYDANPKLLSDNLLFYGLYREDIRKVISYFKVILKNSNCDTVKNLQFDMPEVYADLVKSNCKKIILGLFPELCEASKEYLPEYPAIDFQVKNSRWSRAGIAVSCLRTIAEIVKSAFENCSINYPVETVAYINSIKYPVSGVINEILMNAVYNLPTEFSDSALQWLCRDFESKMFVFSDGNKNRLKCTQEILDKFSSVCSPEIFSLIEKTIIKSRLPRDYVLERYKRKVEYNKESIHYPMFWPSWGQLQKALLPHLDSNIISEAARDIISVLERNNEIKQDCFNSDYDFCVYGPVRSPIYERLDKISDEAWLGIVSNNNPHWDNHLNKIKFKNNNGICSTHEAFANDFSLCVKSNPDRFTKLALRFPDNCNSRYMTELLLELRSIPPKNQMEFKVILALVRKCMKRKEDCIVVETLRLVECYPESEWPEDVLNYILYAAIGSNEQISDLNSSVQDLVTESLNTKSGCAISAIAKLIWEHRCFYYFKDAIDSICESKNISNIMNAVSCLVSAHEIDYDFSYRKLREVLASDIRVLAADGVWWLLIADYEGNRKFYLDLLSEAVHHSDEEVSVCAVRYLCAITIFEDDDDAFHMICNTHFSKKQQEQICLQAISSLSKDEFNQKSKDVILYFAETYDGELPELNQIFYNELVDADRDKDFILRLMGSLQYSQLLSSFLKYFSKLDSDKICAYIDVFKNIEEKMDKDAYELRITFRHSYIDKLLSYIISLYDKGRNIPAIKTSCLDLVDAVFKCNIGNMSFIPAFIHKTSDM